jgi:hypothetical protein
MTDNTTDVLRRQKIAVRQRGDRVVLEIADFGCTMDYETALKLSQWLRVNGKMAKRFAGDMSRHWSTIAILEDAEDSYLIDKRAGNGIPGV